MTPSAREPRIVADGEDRGESAIFLCGDVMTGRGIDQVLPHPSDPVLHERHVGSALDYARLAEKVNGPIPAPVPFAYPWGDALVELERRRPELRLINLETAITTSEAFEPKGINYRMSPDNLRCLTAAKPDVCALANNHVLDWGQAGLAETLDTLRAAGIGTAGAGRTLAEAREPAIVRVGARRRRALVFAAALGSSGVPARWAAAARRAGLWRLEGLSSLCVADVARQVTRFRRPGDIAILSLHWGGNWGYGLSRREIGFAHALVDEAGIDIVHGHSSHHPKAIEIHRGRVILYGCGDLLNDYEGIGGYREFRSDLSLMYFVTLGRADGRVVALALVPMRIRRFALGYAPSADAAWLRRRLERESARFGIRFEPARADGAPAFDAVARSLPTTGGNAGDTLGR